MLWARSDRIRFHVLPGALGAFLFLVFGAPALAQEPPISVPNTLPLSAPGEAIPLGRWLLSPSMRVFSLYSDNLFSSSQSPIHALGLGVSPSLTAEWTNGIHTTTLFGNVERQMFPTKSELNTFDREVSVRQKYDPLQDLTFQLKGDYTHKTVTSGLPSSIPGPILIPSSVLLPDGNTLLPSGTIVDPGGNVVGHTNSPTNVNGTSAVNPYDLFTGEVSVNKILNGGAVGLSTALSRTNYENPGTSSPDLTVRTYSGNGSFWLGPAFYLYSNGTLANTRPDSGAPSSAYRAVGGIGSRQIGLLRGSIYVGHQASETQGSGKAGGEVYGASLSYYPMPGWTVSATVDETVNISSGASTSSLALTFPGQTPLLIPLSSSTRITATSLQSQYTISQQWLASGQLSYTRVDYFGSSRLDNTWVADATLRYDMWRNMTLTWEYQYTKVISNAPFSSLTRNSINMAATYRF